MAEIVRGTTYEGESELHMDLTDPRDVGFALKDVGLAAIGEVVVTTEGEHVHRHDSYDFDDPQFHDGTGNEVVEESDDERAERLAD